MIILWQSTAYIDYNTHPQVCPSCRAFFRRSVQSGYNATYFCVKDGSCQVDNFDERDIGYGICVEGRVDHDDDDGDDVDDDGDDCITAPTFVSEWPFAENLSVFMASNYMYLCIINTCPGHFENKEELPILQIQVSWPLQFVYSNPICLFKSRLLGISPPCSDCVRRLVCELRGFSPRRSGNRSSKVARRGKVAPRTTRNSPKRSWSQ